VTTEPALWRALNLDEVNPPVVAIVGGGGKTALLYRLGSEAATLQRAAILTGTTRFTPHSLPGLETRMIVANDDTIILAARAALSPSRPLVLHSGDGTKGRLQPISSEVADELAALPGLGLLVLEADGSKMLPFKAPAPHEPVIPSSATHVVAVVGLHALGAPLDDAHVHRPERIRAIVGPEERCTAEVIARVLTDERGGRSHVGDRDYTVLVNQTDIDPVAAHELAEEIRSAGVTRVVVASLRDQEQPVFEVLSS
jgi:probable selenium-dependent hydroxylase accessory protein YqeC